MPTDFIDIKRQFSLTDVVNRYVETRKRGKYQVGLCPFHDDSHPSLHLFMGKDGVERYRCFACDAAGDVIDFVAAMHGCNVMEAAKILTGAETKQVMPATPEGYKKKKLKPSEVNKWQPIMPVPDDAPVYDPAATYNADAGCLKDWTRGVERRDPYFDADGNLLFWVVRLDWDNGASKKICPVVTYCEGPNGARHWVARRPEGKLPLQGLHELATWPDAPVMIVSGEKCWAQHAEWTEKFVPVSWVGGDNAVDDTDWSPLFKRKRIFFFPDRDESGRRAMRDIYNIIKEGSK